MLPSNIALVGFMGAGKSTVGRVLAARLGKTFVETDAMVEQRVGLSVAEVFAQRGESCFRELEAQAVLDASQRRGCVIACGGGVVLREDNVVTLKQSCLLVYLDVSASFVLRRLTGQSTVRPLLEGVDRDVRVQELITQRRPVYEAVADITISTDGLAVEQVVRRIQGRLRQQCNESHNTS